MSGDNMKIRKMTLWLALLPLVTPSLSSAQDAEWLVAPYIWYSDVTLDQSSGGSGGISASELLDKTDSVGMIRAEVARKRWGLTVDYLWLGLSDSATIPLPPPGGTNLIAAVDISLVELGGFFRPSGQDSGVDYLFGLRNINVDKTLLATPGGGGPTQRFDSDSDFTDVYAGARYLHRFNNNWDLNLRGDYSFGDSEGMWNLLASVGYRFNQTFALNLGYRHLTVEFEDNVSGGVETTDIELSGPLLGFLFRF
jgi:hypothetical protein